MKLILLAVIIPIFLIVTLLAILFLIRRNRISEEVLYEKGIEEFDLANYSKAKSLFLRAIAKKSDFFEALLRLGLLYYKLLDYEAAKDCFEKIIANDPDNFIATYNLALSMQMLKDYDSAVTHYRKAISLNDKDTDSYFNLAIINFDKKNYLEALGLFEKVKLLSPNQSATLFYIIKCRDELCTYEKPEEAQDIINSYLKLSSRNDMPQEFYTALTKAYAKMGNIKEAMDFCKKSLQANPEDPEGYKLYGLMSVINNDVHSAETNLLIAMQLDPNDEELYDIMRYV